MPYTRPDRKPPDQSLWDDVYLDLGRWIDMEQSVKGRMNDALHLLGDVKGKSILDLGGGMLMSKALFEAGASFVAVVDYSEIGCANVRVIEPRVTTICSDAIRYLEANQNWPLIHDVTIVMGLVCYLPVGSLDKIFQLAPSPVLILNLPIAEGYLEYHDRVTVYSRKDVNNTFGKYGWKQTAGIPSNEHIFARYERAT